MFMFILVGLLGLIINKYLIFSYQIIVALCSFLPLAGLRRNSEGAY